MIANVLSVLLALGWLSPSLKQIDSSRKKSGCEDPFPPSLSKTQSLGSTEGSSPPGRVWPPWESSLGAEEESLLLRCFLKLRALGATPSGLS